MSFGKRVRTELLYRDIQLKDFATRIKIPYYTFLTYIDDKCLPKIDIAFKISNELGVSLEVLLSDANNESYFERTLEQSLYSAIAKLPIKIQKNLLLLIHEVHKYC